MYRGKHLKRQNQKLNQKIVEKITLVVVIVYIFYLVLGWGIKLSNNNKVDTSNQQVSQTQYSNDVVKTKKREKLPAKPRTISQNFSKKLEEIHRENREMIEQSELNEKLDSSSIQQNDTDQVSVDTQVSYTLGDIQKIIEEMNKSEGMTCEFSWDHEAFTEDSLFIDYIMDLMDRWYEEGRISRKWTPDEERFRSYPYYTEEQGNSVTLGNLMYAEVGVYFWNKTFDEAVLACLFTGTACANRIGLFGDTLKEAIFTGGGYPETTRAVVRKQECQRQIIFILAELIIQYGPMGPENLIYQATFKQGNEVYAKIGNTYFCLE